MVRRNQIKLSGAQLGVVKTKHGEENYQIFFIHRGVSSLSVEATLLSRPMINDYDQLHLLYNRVPKTLRAGLSSLPG